MRSRAVGVGLSLSMHEGLFMRGFFLASYEEGLQARSDF